MDGLRRSNTGYKLSPLHRPESPHKLGRTADGVVPERFSLLFLTQLMPQDHRTSTLIAAALVLLFMGFITTKDQVHGCVDTG